MEVINNIREIGGSANTPRVRFLVELAEWYSSFQEAHVEEDGVSLIFRAGKDARALAETLGLLESSVVDRSVDDQDETVWVAWVPSNVRLTGEPR